MGMHRGKGRGADFPHQYQPMSDNAWMTKRRRIESRRNEEPSGDIFANGGMPLSGRPEKRGASLSCCADANGTLSALALAASAAVHPCNPSRTRPSSASISADSVGMIGVTIERGRVAAPTTDGSSDRPDDLLPLASRSYAKLA